MDNLNLIDEAFNALKEQEERFLKCERAYQARYKTDNRTTKLKSTERDSSRLYIPLIKTTINIIHSIFKTSFMSDRCPIEISRIGYRSDNDLILQNALSAILKDKWRSPEHKIGLSKAVLSALYLPLGIVSLYYDKQAENIRTKFIPITDLAFDKNASDINDIEYVAYRWKQSKREIEQKFKTGYYIKKDKELILGSSSMITQRVQMEDIYIKTNEKGRTFWRLESYANKKLVRKAKFSRLPFHFGYCIEAMPNIDLERREEQIAVYGSCIPEIAYEIQEEYNIKRNQKIAIVERQIDPTYIIDKDKGQISISDIASNKKFIRVETNNINSRVSDLIQPLPTPGAYSLSEEISMLNHEYEIATGVNSVMTGQTSPSDRRATSALQVVNAASSSRIESMMQTLLETMLMGYASHFVELLYKHTSDEDFIKITEDENIIEKIGTLEDRKKQILDFDIKTQFGTTMSSELKITQLNGLISMLAQSGLNSPNIISIVLKQILTFILGENAPIEEIDNALMSMQEQQTMEQQAQQDGAEPELDEEQMRVKSLIQGGV